MAPLLIPIVSMLADAGMSLLGSAINGGKEKAVEYIEDKTGIKLDAAKGLSAEDAAKLRELEITNSVELGQLALESKKEDNRHEESATIADNANVADARAMQVAALGQDDKFSKRFVYYFASAWSIFAMVYIGGITFADIPLANVRFADTILGFVLGTVIASFINYFVGTSKGSKDKTDMMHAAMKKGKHD